MKDCSSDMIEKPFSCDVDGCLLRFINEDHLMVHKKRHDMVLNIGLGTEGNTFSDQTPTPTRFFRNCEEVGLFQDLQNVNPFEETFRKAVEAVKTGQTSLLDKSYQSNPPDDTLHTPNVFPNITDLPCVNHNEDLVTKGDRHSDLEHKDEMRNINICDEKHPLKNDVKPQKLILGNISYKKRKEEVHNKPQLSKMSNEGYNLPSDAKEVVHFLQQKTVDFSNYVNDANNLNMTLKEKIGNNINNKQTPMILQLKVPIPKSATSGKYQKSQRDRFSTFSKNSLKFESKLEKSQSGIFDLSRRRKKKKNNNSLQKERHEILERNRAAATRYRERKKTYVSYLEKLSRDLSEANRKLLMTIAGLQNQISELQTELLKHISCSLSDLKADSDNSFINKNEDEGNMKSIQESEMPLVESSRNLSKPNEDRILSNSTERGLVPETIEYSIVEIPVIDNYSSSEDNKQVDFNNVNHFFNDSPSENNFVKRASKSENLKRIYSDHSYFNHPIIADPIKKNLNSTLIRQKLISTLLTKNQRSQNLDFKNDKNSSDITVPSGNSLHSFNEETVVVSHSAQPLILLKPFHKRTALKQTDKT